MSSRLNFSASIILRDEQKLLDLATRLSAIFAHVHELDLSGLYLAKISVLCVSATHTGESRRPDNADCLTNVVFMMESGKIMLTRNLWVDQILTSGSMG